MYSTRKNSRTLDMYVRLCEGRTINKKEEARKFGVDERSIQRDIDDIRAFLANSDHGNNVDTREIVYDRIKEGFVMIGSEGSLMSNDEILAVSKILLESRAFTKKEIKVILNKIVAGCVPLPNMKLVSDLIANEEYHYVEPQHKSSVKGKLWELGEEIKQCNLIEVTYVRQVASNDTVKRVVQPVGIIFSEYYFYLNAYIVEKNEAGNYEQKYDYPAIFRLDRIVKFKETGEKFRIAYANRFEEGEFRNRVQFMFQGPLTKVQFRFTGNSLEAVLDRLPTAKVISKGKNGAVVEAEVYGRGILMWLLSQGKNVEVLRPQSLRNEMKQMLLEMLEKY